MALVVEDGSGLELANAYWALVDVNTYHSDRNNTAWADFTDAQKNAAIIRATDYIDKRFGKRFRGYRSDKSQALEWPRFDAEDNDGFYISGIDAVPRNLQKAMAEYALRAAQIGVLAPDPVAPVPAQSMESGAEERDPSVITGEVLRSRDKVGPIEEERWYETSSRTAARSLGAGAKGVQSSLVNDFVIPEYPEADMWLEELIESSMTMSFERS